MYAIGFLRVRGIERLNVCKYEGVLPDIWSTLVSYLKVDYMPDFFLPHISKSKIVIMIDSTKIPNSIFDCEMIMKLIGSFEGWNR